MFIPLYLKSNLLLCIYYICMDVCTFCIRLFSVTMTTFDSFQLLFFGAQRRLGLANTTFPFNNSTLTDTITHTEHWTLTIAITITIPFTSKLCLSMYSGCHSFIVWIVCLGHLFDSPNRWLHYSDKEKIHESLRWSRKRRDQCSMYLKTKTYCILQLKFAIFGWVITRFILEYIRNISDVSFCN